MNLLASFTGNHRATRFIPTAPAGSANRPEAGEDLDEPDWDHRAGAEHAEPTARDALFWSFFMSTAITALPLIGTRWAGPGGALTAGALDDAVLLSLPAALPLPFLFLACAATLALRPAARTRVAFGTFGASILMAFAASLAFAA